MMIESSISHQIPSLGVHSSSVDHRLNYDPKEEDNDNDQNCKESLIASVQRQKRDREALSSEAVSSSSPTKSPLRKKQNDCSTTAVDKGTFQRVECGDSRMESATELDRNGVGDLDSSTPAPDRGTNQEVDACKSVKASTCSFMFESH
jgi:hypothetical protein